MGQGIAKRHRPRRVGDTFSRFQGARGIVETLGLDAIDGGTRALLGEGQRTPGGQAAAAARYEDGVELGVLLTRLRRQLQADGSLA